jgi:guanine deaminase
MTIHKIQAYRASLLHFTDDPLRNPDGTHWHEDGLLIVNDGHVQAAGDYQQLKSTLPDHVVVEHFPGKIITPGFIDTHIHYPQTDIIASPAPGLLPWLEQYTFPAERQFENPLHAQEVANFFWMNYCVAAPPPRWCIAPCIQHRSTPFSKRARHATYAWSRVKY